VRLAQLGVTRMLYRNAQAGSLESGDVMVRVSPCEEDEVSIHIESKVSPRFSNAIRNTVRQTAQELGVRNARFEIIDHGALDFVLRARVTTALKRAMEAPTNA
jgi:citrate lyase subunit gamma (acyl carrier protein)